jgi:hypothetical protein
MAKTKFDINSISPERQAGPASPGQIYAVSLKFSNLKDGGRDWRLRTQLEAHLGTAASAGKYTLLQAHKDLESKPKFTSREVNGTKVPTTCPQKYLTAIASYLASNPEVS